MNPAMKYTDFFGPGGAFALRNVPYSHPAAKQIRKKGAHFPADTEAKASPTTAQHGSAPSFDHLREADLDEEEFDEDEIDISDLREKYEVQLEHGYDTFIVVDGLPEVTEEQKPRLVKFLMKKFNSVGSTREEAIYMPFGDNGKSLRFAFVEFSSASEAAAAIDEFTPKEHLKGFLKDPSGRGRDQFVMYRGDNVGVFWNNEKENPEGIVDRNHWTETFVQWSPLGTYLTSIHQQGVQLWGGPSWKSLQRFPHPFVNLVAYSPNENYLVTWSARPISVPEEGHPILTIDDDGKNYVIWDVRTGKSLRSFANLDAAGSSGSDDGGKQRKFPWPAFKWSADDQYVARLNQGTSISVYELPRMNLLDKTSIKIDGVMDFDWAPRPPPRGCQAEVVRTLNLFNVSDVKLHWQSEAAYLCVKVDRHSKSKKSQATTLEIFRVKEKGVPVEVVDTIKDTVINFAWEPKGDRFVIITTTEPPGPTAGPTAGNFKHLRTLEKKNSNAIYWSPKGRFVVIATVHNQQSSDLDFFDLDFEGEKPEGEKDLTANLQLMNTADHYGVTDVEWDPSGRFVATWASAWKHAMENGYHIYDFKGEQLKEEALEKFKQFSWRPRPPTLLSKDEQKQIRKNLREYSRVFEQEDADRGASADREVVEARRRLLDEWVAWREQIESEVHEEREIYGLPQDPVAELLKAKVASLEGTQEETLIEEIVEEVLEENEEIIT
ncbi:unnamed protein product [Parascedosporium putredinis]|uniref:Eukaryotic translation initiation factor 3 subunit B n=1 Tax=Parascedosporium putredinis TaxID=1442378 RepID=A0A9P1H682_9PEZI|nr:unnamed protein product [Parascedosporium putredinis]CAI7997369.1 unnamed protein product [Parascedosporium putredinis]